MAKHRTQLFLEQDQYTAVSRIAERENCTISTVVRELIDRGLEVSRLERERRLRVLDELAELGAQIGPISEDPIAKVRAEREAQLDRVLRGSE